MQFSNLGGEIVIEANSAGLKPLAGHLLTLAQDGTPDARRCAAAAAHGRTALPARPTGPLASRDAAWARTSVHEAKATSSGISSHDHRRPVMTTALITSDEP
ncbi:Imm32 family immunity protein [Streptomyces griseorubiginosus]|uniref:Imm32 family immunity protein n=1 Tax=Streptomyces griseorubiginosus TaxID=67304 RepID=UPI004056D5DA